MKKRSLHQSKPSLLYLNRIEQDKLYIQFVQENKSQALLITAQGKCLTLKTFRGSLYPKFKEIYQEVLSRHSNEFADLKAREHYESDSPQKIAVKHFTAKCQDLCEPLVQFIKKIGFNSIRPLSSKKRGSDFPESLYSIVKEEVKSAAEKFIPVQNIIWEFQELSN